MLKQFCLDYLELQINRNRLIWSSRHLELSQSLVRRARGARRAEARADTISIVQEHGDAGSYACTGMAFGGRIRARLRELAHPPWTVQCVGRGSGLCLLGRRNADQGAVDARRELKLNVQRGNQGCCVST